MSDYLIYYLELNMERSILTFKKHHLLTQCHTVQNMEIKRDKPLRIRLKKFVLYIRLEIISNDYLFVCHLTIKFKQKIFYFTHPQFTFLML